jgi:hypothetical protein
MGQRASSPRAASFFWKLVGSELQNLDPGGGKLRLTPRRDLRASIAFHPKGVHSSSTARSQIYVANRHALSDHETPAQTQPLQFDGVITVGFLRRPRKTRAALRDMSHFDRACRADFRFDVRGI